MANRNTVRIMGFTLVLTVLGIGGQRLGSPGFVQAERLPAGEAGASSSGLAACDTVEPSLSEDPLEGITLKGVLPSLTEENFNNIRAQRSHYERLIDVWRLNGQGKVDEAFAGARIIVETDVGFGPGIDAFVQLATDSGHLEESETLFEERVATSPQDWTGWYGLARSRVAKKAWSEAKEAGGQALELGCTYWGCFADGAAAFEALGQLDDGVTYFLSLVEESNGDPLRIGLAWFGLGDLLDGTPARRTEAQDALARSAALLSPGMGWEQGRFLLATNLMGQGLPGQALELYQQALVVFRELGNRRDEGRALSNLAVAYSSAQSERDGVYLYEQALLIHREVGNRQAEAKLLGNLANTYKSLGQLDKALGLYHESLLLLRSLGDQVNEANVLGNLGAAYQDKGDMVGAIGTFEEALALHREVGNRAGEGAVLGNLGAAYVDVGEFTRGAELHLQALAIHQQTGNRRHEGLALGNLGITYQMLGDVSNALGAYQEALAIHRQVQNQSAEGIVLGNIGNVYRQLGDIEKTLECYNLALDLHRQLGNRHEEAIVLGNLGVVYSELGQLELSIQVLSQSILLHREVENRWGEGAVLGSMGVAYRDLGQPLMAIGFFERALVIHREVGNRKDEGITLGNLGLACWDLGDNLRAIGWTREALSVHRELGYKRGEATATFNMGAIFKQSGENARSIATYEQALAIYREIGDRRGEGSALGNLGVAYHDRGDVGKALSFYQQALVIHQEVGNTRSEGLLLGNVGNAQFDLGDVTGAIQTYGQGLVLMRTVGNREGERQIVTSLSRSEAFLGRRQTALSSVTHALELGRTLTSELDDLAFESSYFAQDTRAYPLEIRILTSDLPGNPAPTLTSEVLSHSFTSGEEARSQSFHRGLQVARIDARDGAPPEALAVFHEAEYRLNQVQSLLAQGGDSPAERYTLQTWLADQLAPYLERHKLIGGELPPSAQLLEKQIAAVTAGTLSAEERGTLLQRLLAEREEALAQAERHLRDVTPAYRALVEPRLATLEEVQQALDPDTLMITYLLGEDESFAWAVTREGTHLLHLLKEREITTAVSAFRQHLTNPESIVGSSDPAIGGDGIASQSRALAETLGIKQALSYAPLATHLVIVADGSLGGLPFEALAHDTGVGGEIPWLGLSHTITYAPSATVWWEALVDGNKPSSETLLSRPMLIVADPIYHEDTCVEGDTLLATRGPDTRAGLFNESWSRLCASGEEARLVTKTRKSLFGNPDDIVWLGSDASEQAFLSEDLARFSILHFATHAKAYEDVPLRSAIVLSQQNLTSIGESSEVEVGDGYLDMREISKLKLDADLAVLSGCDTAQGRKRPGEGVESLARAFLMAGARQVVASQWQVADESTARFMARFYEEMRDVPPAEALARTKQAFMRGEEGFEVRGPDGKKVQVEWSHPYYWAPFILIEGGRSGAKE